ncbi:hypothetical protein AAUPMC_14730, partial [Pasteurella multocida subsp. multocida str. Anand1_cattle]
DQSNDDQMLLSGYGFFGSALDQSSNQNLANKKLTPTLFLLLKTKRGAS